MKQKIVASLVTLIILLLMSSAFMSFFSQVNIAEASSSPTVFQDGFESGLFNAFSVAGSASIVSSPVNSGSFAAKATGPNAYWTKTLDAGYSDLYFSGYIQVPSKLANGQQTLFLYILDRSYSYVVAGGLQTDSSGNAHWALRATNWYYSTSFSLQTNHWYFMQIEYNTAGTANLYVDGTLVCSATGQTLPSNAQIVQGGNPFSYTPSGYVSYGDDYQAATQAASTPTPTPVSDPLWLHASGTNIYDSSGNQVKLHSVVIQSCDGNHISQNDIQKIKNMGFNCIRVFIEWGLVQPNGPTSINTAYFTQASGASSTFGAGLDYIINWAYALGIYVIISPSFTDTWAPPSWVTSLIGSSYNDLMTGVIHNAQVQSGINYMYNWLGQHYASNSNVIFEGFNELSTINNNDGGSTFANFNNGWVSAIEQGEGSNSHLKIIEFLMDDNSWVEIFTPPYISGSHSNIMLATHNYAPMYWDPNGSYYTTTWVNAVTYINWRCMQDAAACQAVNRPWIDTEWSKDITQNQWQLFYQTVLQGFSQYNAAGWSYFCYDSNTNAQSSAPTTWNINNPNIGPQVLPILQQAMV